VEAWGREVLPLADDTVALMRIATSGDVSWSRTLDGIEDALRDRSSRGEPDVVPYGALVSTDLHDVVQRALSSVDDPRVPAMPSELTPGLSVLAEPDALRVLIARMIVVALGQGCEVSLSFRRERDHLLLYVLERREDRDFDATPPHTWIEDALRQRLARVAGVLPPGDTLHFRGIRRLYLWPGGALEPPRVRTEDRVAHVVWAVAHRHRVLGAEDDGRLRSLLTARAREVDAQLLFVGCGGDHVHVVVRYPAACTLAEVVRRMKGGEGAVLHDAEPPHGWHEGHWAEACAPEALAGVIRSLASGVMFCDDPSTTEPWQAALFGERHSGI
jgi:REP element-mobilizing transposase RayT